MGGTEHSDNALDDDVHVDVVDDDDGKLEKSTKALATVRNCVENWIRTVLLSGQYSLD